jgi:hypothetical protein
VDGRVVSSDVVRGDLSSVDASPFGCFVILSLYLTLSFLISSLIVGTFSSVRKTLFDIYCGAFAIARMTLFCYLCNISILNYWLYPRGVCGQGSTVVIEQCLSTAGPREVNFTLSNIINFW